MIQGHTHMFDKNIHKNIHIMMEKEDSGWLYFLNVFIVKKNDG